jgi:hypothetical protein
MTTHALADQAMADVMADLADDSHRGLVVDAPPGAGKSALVVRAAADMAAAGEPVMGVAQTNGHGERVEPHS